MKSKTDYPLFLNLCLKHENIMLEKFKVSFRNQSLLTKWGVTYNFV